MSYTADEGSIIDIYARHGESNLSGWEDQAIRLIDEMDSMKGETIQESQAISHMVDAMQPGIGSDVTVIGFLTAGMFGPVAGATARQFLTARDAANALFERATALFNEWDNIYTYEEGFSRPDVSLSTIQDYHRRFKEVLDAHKEFLGKTTDIVDKGPEVAAQEKQPKGPIEEMMSDVLWYGGIAAVGWFVVIPMLKKKYA